MSKLRVSSSTVLGSRDGGWRLGSPGSGVVTAAALLEAGRRTDTEAGWLLARPAAAPPPASPLPAPRPGHLATIATALAEAD